MKIFSTQKKIFDKSRIQGRKKFLHYFPKGFTDRKYTDWERDYKWDAHLTWEEELNREEYEKLLKAGKHSEIAKKAVRLESRTNLLFSFEKMALRDAVKTPEGARDFAIGLFDYVYGKALIKNRFENFSQMLTLLPRKQTRVQTWPLQTIFGFIANPDEHIFLKPRVTQNAAKQYNYEFLYRSQVNWETYSSFLEFSKQIYEDIKDLKPRDYIDIQSFIWVLGSEEYPD